MIPGIRQECSNCAEVLIYVSWNFCFSFGGCHTSSRNKSLMHINYYLRVIHTALLLFSLRYGYIHRMHHISYFTTTFILRPCDCRKAYKLHQLESNCTKSINLNSTIFLLSCNFEVNLFFIQLLMKLDKFTYRYKVFNSILYYIRSCFGSHD